MIRKLRADCAALKTALALAYRLGRTDFNAPAGSKCAIERQAANSSSTVALFGTVSAVPVVSNGTKPN